MGQSVYQADSYCIVFMLVENETPINPTTFVFGERSTTYVDMYTSIFILLYLFSAHHHTHTCRCMMYLFSASITHTPICICFCLSKHVSSYPGSFSINSNRRASSRRARLSLRASCSRKQRTSWPSVTAHARILVRSSGH